MSLVLSTLPSLYPVYSDDLVLTASESTANSSYTYRFAVTIDSILYDTFDIYANPTTYSAEIDLSTILSTYFTSSVYTPSNQNAVYEKITGSIVSYSIAVTVFNASMVQVSTANTGTKYCFNGVVQNYIAFNIADYLINTGGNKYFLTNYHTNREITIEDKAYINTITGDYTTFSSDFGGIKVTRFQEDGTSSTITSSYSDNTSKSILNINVSPNVINTLSTNFINSNTLYYTIDEIDNKNSIPMQINIVKEYKLKKFYNFLYLNSLGGIDFFTAVKASNNKISIEKDLLNKYYNSKVYNTRLENETTVLTQILNEYQADKLKELFYSPAVQVNENFNKLNDITITNSSITIQDRYPKQAIQYSITYSYKDKTLVQKY